MIIQDNNWFDRGEIDSYGKIEDAATNAERRVKKFSPEKLQLNTFVKHLFRT